MDSGLRVSGGCSVGCGRGIYHSGSLTGGARYRVLGWGLLVAFCASAFREGSWASVDRALRSAYFARLLFSSHEYHLFSVETNAIFLTQLQNPETL